MILTKKEINRRYYKKHREEIIKRNRKWVEENREWINKYNQEYYQKHLKSLYAQRRAEFMIGKSCLYCKSIKDLVLHHIDPNIKDPGLESRSNHIWKWEESRRNKELKKCVVICKSCHSKLHAKDKRKLGGSNE